ncbi:MAG: hypothetical protein L0387_43340 [Acidobacteria bacterium]|nr:hypothetical protein [Acidobacteriota bacterium]MCI0723217.1 hypothetical protein [Acidobacteriota bacterium]
MHYFDYESVALAANIAPETLEEIRALVRSDFAEDEMMCELHILRACMAIQSGLVTAEEILQPATGASDK